MKKVILGILLSFVLLSGLGVISAFNWNDSLVAYYNLDESSGTIAHDATGINNGTNNGVTVNVSGRINNSYDFRSVVDNYVDVGNIADYQGHDQFTVTAWIYLNTTSRQQWIFAHDNNPVQQYALGVSDQGKLYVEINGGLQQTMGNTVLSTGTWYYVAFVLSGSNIEIFLNGNSDVSDLRTSINDGTDTNARIGARSYNGQHNPFDGKIDELGIWNRSLSSIEVSQLYNNGQGLAFGQQPAASNITITLNSPANGFVTSANQINFNGSVNSSNTLQNVTLNLDGVVNQTVPGIGSTNYLFTANEPIGNHNWSYTACDVSGFCSTSNTRTFSVANISVFENINVTNSLYALNGFFTNIVTNVLSATNGFFTNLFASNINATSNITSGGFFVGDGRFLTNLQGITETDPKWTANRSLVRFLTNLSFVGSTSITGNLTTTSNITSGGFFVGDGRFLTNLPVGTEVDPKWTANASLVRFLNNLSFIGNTNITGSLVVTQNITAPWFLGFINASNVLNAPGISPPPAQVIIFNGRSSVSLTADAFGNPNGGVMAVTADPSMGATIPFAGTISNLTATMSVAQNAGDACRITIMKSSTPIGVYVNTNLNATILNTAQTATNSTYSASVNAGDSLRVFFDEVNGTCTGFVGWTFVFTKN